MSNSGSSEGNGRASRGDSIESQVIEIFSVKLNRAVPSADIDLVERGILDSLAFVDLLMFLEQSYGITIHEDMLEIDNFRSVRRIAEFVAKHMDGRST